MKKFLKHLNVLNLMLFAAILLSLSYNFAGAPTDIPSGRLHSSRIKNVLPEGIPFFGKKAASEDTLELYSLIEKQNLFNPERSMPIEKPHIAPTLPPQPKPNLILLGTTVSGNSSVAYIKRKVAGPGNITPFNGTPVFIGTQSNQPGVDGEKPKFYKKGDSIDGFILTSIETDKVLLVRGNDTIVVYFDQSVKDLPGRNLFRRPGLMRILRR